MSCIQYIPMPCGSFSNSREAPGWDKCTSCCLSSVPQDPFSWPCLCRPCIFCHHSCYLIFPFFIFAPNMHKPPFPSVPIAAPQQSGSLTQDFNKNSGMIKGWKQRWRQLLDGWLHPYTGPIFFFSCKCFWLLNSAISHLPTSQHFLGSLNVGWGTPHFQDNPEIPVTSLCNTI